MLIEFSVSNFRSIRDRQTLSLVANNRDKTLPENTVPSEAPGLVGNSILKSIVIFGANASGKSNVVGALGFLKALVVGSATDQKPGDETGVEPFKLDHASLTAPTEFEVAFVLEQVRYRYTVVLDRDRVQEERLEAYPHGRPQRWFSRTLNPENGAYVWRFSETNFARDTELSARTRDNALFVSVAAQFNHPQLTPIYGWFRYHLRTVNVAPSSADFMAEVTAERLAESVKYQEFAAELLRWADLGIEDLQLDPAEPGHVQLLHLNPEMNEYVPFELGEESAGTQRFFKLIGPLTDTLQFGLCVIFDEFDTSLHPLLLRHLILVIHGAAVEEQGAQLILTTHDTTLLDSDLLRRDQVWFAEKDRAGATRLYPLGKHHPRKGEAIGKGYLSGRYGAVPRFDADVGEPAPEE